MFVNKKNMNTSCKPNTELSRCIWNSTRPIGKADLARGLLPFPSKNEIRIRRGTRKVRAVVSMSRTEAAEKSDGLTYKDAGVDIDAGSELVKRIAKMAPGIGGFGGLFPLGITLSLRSVVDAEICSLILEFD